MPKTIPCAGDCGRELDARQPRKTGMCRPCYSKRQHELDPSRAQKISAAMKEKFTDPAYRYNHRARTAAGIRDAMENDPAFREQRQALGRMVGRLGRGFSSEPAGSEKRAASGRKQSATKLRHIPAQYRPLYRELVDSKQMSARDAANHCRAKATADRQKPVSFEEQLRRIEQGAKIIKKFDPRPADHAFTLGGVASGMI